MVAAELTNEITDRHQLEPMIAATDRMLQAIAHPNAVGITVADASYWTDRQLGAALAEGRRVLLNPSTSSPLKRPAEQSVRLGRPAPPRVRGVRRLMHALLETEECREVYGRRRELVEPVFGQIKIGRGAGRFQRRGYAACRSEWRMIAATHNLLKLWRHGLGAGRPLPAAGCPRLTGLERRSSRLSATARLVADNLCATATIVGVWRAPRRLPTPPLLPGRQPSPARLDDRPRASRPGNRTRGTRRAVRSRRDPWPSG